MHKIRKLFCFNYRRFISEVVVCMHEVSLKSFGGGSDRVMLLNLITRYADAHVDLCIKIISLCSNLLLIYFFIYLFIHSFIYLFINSQSTCQNLYNTPYQPETTISAREPKARWLISVEG